MSAIDRISLEPSRRCAKGCSFCYNGSSPSDDGAWSADDVIDFALDCARHGVAAISFGGGEPLEWAPLFEVLDATRGALIRSMTTNGLLLDVDRLKAHRPDKVHVSIHAPENPREVARVVAQVTELADAGMTSGVNLLVRASRLDAAAHAAKQLHDARIENDRIVYLPMRGEDTPSPEDVARVAGAPRFQSMTCLSACGKSPRFASIAADRTVAWCSYTVTRAPLAEPTHAALLSALEGLGLTPCAGALVKSQKKLPMVNSKS